MRIVLIGGGFTASLTAAHLTKHPQFAAGRLEITLVERAAEVGLGIAYSTPFASHVLNVPALNMSPWPAEPDHLLHYLRAQTHAKYPSDNVEEDFALKQRFVPRGEYGAYLKTIVAEAQGRGLKCVKSEARGLRQIERDVRVQLADGSFLQADRVALCLGHFTPVLPRVPGGDTLRAPQYIANPWLWSATRQIERTAEVFVLGTGLTMVDLVLGLREQDFRGRITAVSRHGLAPLPHVLGLAKQPTALPTTDSAALLVRYLRHSIRARTDEGGDWRQVIDGLRQATPHLWQSLSVADQKQILRHAKSYWDVHRHRIAPQVARLLNQERELGRLRIVAGRLQQVTTRTDGVEVSVKRRHDGQQELFSVHNVINCTGGHNNWQRAQVPLVQDLLAQKLVSVDTHGVGIKAARDGRVLDAKGKANEQLFVAGPALVGRDFESIAVPELRIQAEQLAEQLAR